MFMLKYESFQLKLFLDTLTDPLEKNKKTHRGPNGGMWTTSKKNLTYNRDSFSYGDKTFSEKTDIIFFLKILDLSSLVQ